MQAWGDCITGRGAEARAAGTEWGKGGEAGARRIVILSNVLRGFCVADVPPRPGDLFLHINHAVHQAASMASAGCFHWLYVLRGVRLEVAHPPLPRGVRRLSARHLPRLTLPLSAFPWYHTYRAAGGASSLTTGFILANSFRHWFPGLPLILAGFDPAHDHGSCRWHAHSWNLEALWYRRRGFLTIPPRDP